MRLPKESQRWLHYPYTSKGLITIAKALHEHVLNVTMGVYQVEMAI